MEDRDDAGVNELSSAVTDPRRLTRWIAEVEGDLRVGGRIRAHFTSGWEGWVGSTSVSHRSVSS